MNRKVGCGLWVVWMVGALFAAEWLLLWFVLHTIPREYLVTAVMGIVVLTIIVGSLAVYFRVQRRAR